MKKITYLLIALGLAAFATVGTTSAIAQSYDPSIGSGNIAPNTSLNNPYGYYRYGGYYPYGHRYYYGRRPYYRW